MPGKINRIYNTCSFQHAHKHTHTHTHTHTRILFTRAVVFILDCILKYPEEFFFVFVFFLNFTILY